MIKNNVIYDSWKFFSKAEKIAFVLLFILLVAVGIAVPVLLPSASLQNVKLSKQYVAGELVDEDILSPVNIVFIDEVATEQKHSQAMSSVFPVYAYDLSSTIFMRTLMDTYLSSIAENRPDEAAAILKANGISDTRNVNIRLSQLDSQKLSEISELSREALADVFYRGLFKDADLQNSILSGYDRISANLPKDPYSYDMVPRDLDISSLLSSSKLYEFLLDQGLAKYPVLGYTNIRLIADTVSLFATPNVHYDSFRTAEERSRVAEDAGSVTVSISKGDVIAAKDTVITEQQLRIIDTINGTKVPIKFQNVVAQTLFLITVLLFSLFFIFFFIPYKFRVPLYTIIFLVGLIIVLLISYFLILYVSSSGGWVAFEPTMPFLLLPVLFTFMTNKRRVGFSVGFVSAGFAVLFPNSGKYSFFYLLVMIEASVLFIRLGTNRIDVIYEAFYSALTAALVTIIFSILNDYSYTVMFNSIVVVVLNVASTYIFVSILLPLMEKIFNIPTSFRLHELSYTDNPTLNRLNQVAPGTFNHVRNVSDMAYLASKAIGANAELARVGALYHDIGKSEHPEYFIENQAGTNAHDLLNRNLSAAVIKSHVKLGVEKGREIGLPQEVLDIIGEHHGNDIITYFYNAAKREAQGKDILVSEEDFRYNGQIPQTPESGIVMLADCVEAASRTIKNPNTQKYDRLIMNIIISKINHDQLSDSKLTLTDLFKIKDTFIITLVGRDHQRIEYNNDKE